MRKTAAAWLPLFVGAALVMTSLAVDEDVEQDAKENEEEKRRQLEAFWDQLIEELEKHSGTDTDTTKTSVLMTLAMLYEVDMVEYYIKTKKPDLDEKKIDGTTALNNAAFAGNAEVVKLLVDSDADVDMPDEIGQSPLMTASTHGHTAIAEMLIEGGASLEAATSVDNTALTIAVQRGHDKMTEFLLGKGAKIDLNKQLWKAQVMMALRSTKEYDKKILQLIRETSEEDDNNKKVFAWIEQFVENGMKVPPKPADEPELYWPEGSKPEL